MSERCHGDHVAGCLDCQPCIAERDALRAQLAERDATIAVMREALERATRLCCDVHEEDCPAYSDPLGDNVNNGCDCYLAEALSSDAGKRHAERVAALERVAAIARKCSANRKADAEEFAAALRALDALGSGNK